MINENTLIEAAEIIKNSQYVVVFTGAGISTESGIEDFRSEGGLWSKFDPSVYASYHYFLEDPSKFWEMHNSLTEIVANAKPNLAHLGIAELEKLGKVKAVITQNVDMLHQKAGTGKFGAKIYQLHGEYGVLECIKCRKDFKYDEIDTKNVKFPVCEECEGYIKPKVVLFGEQLPHGIIEGAMSECHQSDCFIMCGSSLTVSPANYMPIIAKQNGAKIIFINRDNTVMDDLADIFLKGSAGEIFNKLIEKVLD